MLPDRQQRMGDDTSRSLCAVFALLIEEQLRSPDPDMDVVYEQLGNIKQNCSLMANAAGETPEHLEQYQFSELGDDADTEGASAVDGRELPNGWTDLTFPPRRKPRRSRRA
jgi:hypothetical protein